MLSLLGLRQNHLLLIRSQDLLEVHQADASRRYFALIVNNAALLAVC